MHSYMNKIGQIKIGAFFLSKLSSANVSKHKTTHNVKFIVLVFIYEIRVKGRQYMNLWYNVL